MVNLIWVRFIKAFSWEKSSDRALVDQSLCSQYVSQTTTVKHPFAHNLDSLFIILFQYFFAGSRVVNLILVTSHKYCVYWKLLYIHNSITTSKMILLCTCMTAYCVYGNHTIVIGNFRQGRIVNYSQGIYFFHLTEVHTLSSSIPWAWFPQKIIPHILISCRVHNERKGCYCPSPCLSAQSTQPVALNIVNVPIVLNKL